ncbi:ATP-binding protein [Halovivax limisalsi]|uniref:sensor histidine kinase n=1 Tax=Halovivax limisalsi TaxID=1453760 RepID=UPI001FFDBB1E|nr:ATP-binding protein [Halovivax limisalsi]
MTVPPPTPITVLSETDPVFVAYVAVFGLAALACFASLAPLGRIDDRDTRRGLVGLIGLSGGWAASQVGFLAAPWTTVKLGSYVVGLVLGFAAVVAWLYFCSAYTGRSYHRERAYRRVAAGLFVAVIGLKLTNPLHQGYFSAVEASTPFPHLSMQTGSLHWTAMGLAYALSFVGFFMLFEHFVAVDFDTRPLLVLAGLTGLPVVFDLVGYATPYLIDMTYEPLGVALFAVGVGYVHLERFELVRLAAERESPIVSLDSVDRIRDTNRAARDLFPALADGRGDPFETVLPAVADALATDDPILETAIDGQKRYLRVTATPLGTATAGLGRTIVFTDVTERERYRRELERQNDRLERFAGMVSHDLRNPLTVAQGNVELAREGADAAAAVDEIEAALDRMDALIEDVLALARQGQPIDDPEPVALSVLVRDSWQMVDSTQASLSVDGDIEFEGDKSRLTQLLENLFRNAIDHGGRTVSVTVGVLADGDGFYVADDGPGIPEAERETVFEQGYTTDANGTGFGLAIVAEVVEAHGWTIRATESATGGARFEVSAIDSARATDRAEPAVG